MLSFFPQKIIMGKQRLIRSYKQRLSYNKARGLFHYNQNSKENFHQQLNQMAGSQRLQVCNRL